MKLYRIKSGWPGSGKWAATQSEARQLAGRGGKFEQVDVPTSDGREALAAFLNELAAEPLTRDDIVYSNTPDMQRKAAELMAPIEPTEEIAADDRRGPYGHRLEERAALMGVKREVAEIAEQIMEMDGEALGQCALAVASRFKELGR
jgi:hypothetical protein